MKPHKITCLLDFARFRITQEVKIMNLKKILAVSTAAASLFAFAGCAQKPAQDNSAADNAAKTESDMEYLKGNGKMVIGYTLFSPMNYMEGDELTGFETEFAKAVCEKIGIEPEFQEINWGTKEIELNSKNIDCIWNGMTITDEIKTNLSVTIPYMENRQVLIVKSADKDKYTASLDGAKVVAEEGSAGADLAESDPSFASADFTPVDSQAKALMDVASGQSDIAVIDYIMSTASIGEGTDFTDLVMIDNGYDSEQYGVAFRKGSDVTEKVNEAMKELKADGTLNQIAEKYKLGELVTVE